MPFTRLRRMAAGAVVPVKRELVVAPMALGYGRWIAVRFSNAFSSRFLETFGYMTAAHRLYVFFFAKVCTLLGRIAMAVSCFCQVPGLKSAQSQDCNADHRAAAEAVGLL